MSPFPPDPPYGPGPGGGPPSQPSGGSKAPLVLLAVLLVVGVGAFFLLSGEDEGDSAVGESGGLGPPPTLGEMEMPEVPELDPAPAPSASPAPPEPDESSGAAAAGEAAAVPAGSEDDDCRSSDTLCADMATDCQSGDMTACDTLWLRTRVGSEWEEYGATCGGRTDDWMSGDCEETFG